MKSFGLTMAFAILVSMLVSFTLTPMLAARFLKVDRHGKNSHSSKDSRVFHAIDVLYTRVLEWAMAHRAIVAAAAVLVLFSSVPLFKMANKNFMYARSVAQIPIARAHISIRATAVRSSPRRSAATMKAAGGR